MGPFLVIAVVVAVGVIVGLLVAKKNNKLYESGAAYRGRPADFYTQMHTFRTTVPNLEVLLNVIDGRTLAQQAITVIRDSADRLVFRDAMDRFRYIKEISIIEFNEKDIVRHPLVKQIVAAYKG